MALFDSRLLDTMRTKIVIFLVLILVLIIGCFYFLSALERSERKARVVHATSALLSTYHSNYWKGSCRVFPYTNHFAIGGKIYQCVLAADSWDYQGKSNLMAFTTNQAFLYIDKHGAVLVNRYPPGYDSIP